jgi:hypothetical protein
MGRMIGGKWTDDERVFDQNRFLDVKGSIERQERVMQNPARNAKLFYLEEMSKVIGPTYSISNSLAGMSKIGLGTKPFIELRYIPHKAWRAFLELVSWLVLYIFALLEKTRAYFVDGRGQANQQDEVRTTKQD